MFQSLQFLNAPKTGGDVKKNLCLSDSDCTMALKYVNEQSLEIIKILSAL